MKDKGQCEAKYGDKRCMAEAKTIVASGGQIFHFCTDCARVARKQIYLNNK